MKSKSRWLAAVPFVVLLVGLAVWEAAARSGRLFPLFFPAPTFIVANFGDLIQKGTMGEHVLATVSRLALGLLFGCIPGWFLGLMMGWNPTVRTLFDPVIGAIHPIPKIAILPLLLVIFGLGEAPRIFAVALAGFFPTLISSQAGVRAISPGLFEAVRSCGAKPWHVFLRVVVPGALPMTLAGVRIGINVGLTVTIASEFVSARRGIGVLLFRSWETMRTADLYAGIIVTAVIGFTVVNGLRWLGRKLVPWQPEAIR